MTDEQPAARVTDERTAAYQTYLARGAIYGTTWSGYRRWLGEVDPRFAREGAPVGARALPPLPARETTPQ
jgi:hypothetical protein